MSAPESEAPVGFEHRHVFRRPRRFRPLGQAGVDADALGHPEDRVAVVVLTHKRCKRTRHPKARQVLGDIPSDAAERAGSGDGVRRVPFESLHGAVCPVDSGGTQADDGDANGLLLATGAVLRRLRSGAAASS
jgi:hypothetical protein